MASDSETSSPSGTMASRSMTEPLEHSAATSCVVACLAPSLAGSGHLGVIQRIRFMFTDPCRESIEAQAVRDFTPAREKERAISVTFGNVENTAIVSSWR